MTNPTLNLFEALERRDLMTSVGLSVVQHAIEGVQPGIIEVSRSDAQGSVNVQLFLDRASSTAGSNDYSSSVFDAVPSVVRFTHGELTKQIEVNAVRDGVSEGSELLVAKLVDLAFYDVDPHARTAQLELHDYLEFADRTSLSIPDGTQPREWEIELANISDSESEFFLQVNGQLWVNLPHLIQHVRSMPEAFPGETDYQRAFRFMKDNTRHDYLVSVEDSNWHRSSTTFLNSIGFGFCGDMSTALTFMWREMGYDARVWRLSGHTVSEVFADGRWQMYDADLLVHFYNEDGQVAGVEELANNPSLILRPINQVKVPDRISFNVYSNRMADIYSTTDNNYICEDCYPDQSELDRELRFKLPAGATINVGDRYSERELPLFDGQQTAWDFGQLKVTVPAGYTGEIDLSLALFDVKGQSTDRVAYLGEQFAVNSDAMYERINFDEAGRLGAISFDNNAAPVELIYLINPLFAQLQGSNEIQIEQIAGTAFDVQLVAIDQSPTRFAWDLTGTAGAVVAESSEGGNDGYVRRLDLQSEEGMEFIVKRGQFVDLATIPAEEIFRGDNSFTIEASIELNAGDNFLRPIVDSARFSFAVDDQNKLTASYQTGDEIHETVQVNSNRVLSAGEWHNVSVKATEQSSGQLVELFVGDERVGSQLGSSISNSYTLEGPFIGLRFNPGRSDFFSGRMKNVSIESHDVQIEEPKEKSSVASFVEIDKPDVAEVDGRNVPGEVVAAVTEVDDSSRRSRRENEEGDESSTTSPKVVAPAIQQIRFVRARFG